MEQLISIIVPVYNMEECLKKCVDSIQNQTYKNLEIILIDDGSTDGGGKICDEYAEKDGRIRVIHKENGGQATARNMGLDIASGEYVGFVDSDDWILPDMYEFLYNGIKNYNADIAVCGVIYGPYGRKLIKYGSMFKSERIEVLDTSQTLQFHCSEKLGFAPWNKLYARKIWDKLRFPICFREDEAVMYTVMSLSSKTVVLPDEKYIYILRKGSSERSGFSEKYLISNKTTDEMYDYIKHNYPKIEKDAWDMRISIRIRQIDDIILSGCEKKNNDILNDMLDFIKNNKAYSEPLRQKSEFIINYPKKYFKYVKRKSRKMNFRNYIKKVTAELNLYNAVKMILDSVRK